MSWLLMVIWPWIVRLSIRSFIRFSERSRVDLPQPDGPISAVTSPRWKVRLISYRAWALPYHRLKSDTSITEPSGEVTK